MVFYEPIPRTLQRLVTIASLERLRNSHGRIMYVGFAIWVRRIMTEKGGVAEIAGGESETFIHTYRPTPRTLQRLVTTASLERLRNSHGRIMHVGFVI